ncbi:MAG TPA: zf-HC2 domain-containing protein [Tepidisphaeraceae bacterium]|jgi:anti-sigma factor RsiW|nr:zf-HC2 domain-containing protein [Tepidisphaeraceae bacterium]
MTPCDYQSRLSAFHDRELDADMSRQVEEHLAGCPECTEVLAGIAAVSRLLHGANGGRMSQMGMARLHATADAAAAKQREIFPLAKTLIAVAASVFVIAGAWLTEVPSHTGGSTPMVQNVAPEKEWETLASGGRLKLPSNIANDTDVAVDWMIKGLK